VTGSRLAVRNCIQRWLPNNYHNCWKVRKYCSERRFFCQLPNTGITVWYQLQTLITASSRSSASACISSQLAMSLSPYFRSNYGKFILKPRWIQFLYITSGTSHKTNCMHYRNNRLHLKMKWSHCWCNISWDHLKSQMKFTTWCTAAAIWTWMKFTIMQHDFWG